MDILGIIAGDGLLPEDFAGSLVDAEGVAGPAMICSGGEEELAVPMDGRGLAVAGEVDFPDNGGGVPFGGDILLLGDADAFRAPETCPFFGVERKKREEEEQEKDVFHMPMLINGIIADCEVFWSMDAVALGKKLP